MPDPFRGVHRKNEALGASVEAGTPIDLGEFYARFVLDSCKQSEGQGGGVQVDGVEVDGVAAFICESILSCGGQVILPDGFLEAAYAHVRSHGGICIADEVQVGFGRVGSNFWGFEMQGVIPDIVTMGKPIGNGHPLAAVVTNREIADAFDNGMEYFNTFGGNPVSCAVGLAVLDVIEEEQLMANAKKVGDYFMRRLSELKENHQLIGDVRGSGLFVGVEFVDNEIDRNPNPEIASYIVERMRESRILLSTDGPANNVIKIKPPMIFTNANVDHVINALRKILNETFVLESETRICLPPVFGSDSLSYNR